ncbi:MAG TPA: carbohydrate ABC transporter permease [Anaerolineae bacterium]|nr:carbohydrate ABC transporter permease [Anaerolineae bacterium]
MTTSPTRILGNILYWVVLAIAFIFFMFPLVWMLITSIKVRADVTSLPPTFIPWLQFNPTTINYLAVFTRVSEAGTVVASSQANTELSKFPEQLANSVIICGIATIAAVLLGTLAAYAFSRFRIPGEGDLLFFILSTRMMPAIVVLIPIFLMFSLAGLRETYLGITLLYITFGLPFVVWMMKGFLDEIPKEYEEAAMLDGYSRLEAIIRIVLPETLPAMLATAVFVLITAWNEFVFVIILNPSKATTVPPFLYGIIGYGQVEWGRMAATSVVFLLPVVIFTFLVRNHLLRGVTFGAVRR